MTSYILPGGAGYYLHGLTGYGSTVLPAGALSSAFMPSSIDQIAAYTAALPASMSHLSFDSPLVPAGAHNGDGSVSDLSPTPSSSVNPHNGLDLNGGSGHALYSPHGLGIVIDIIMNYLTYL